MDAQRTPAIDALRGCAVLCVVLLHIQIHMPQEQSLLADIAPGAVQHRVPQRLLRRDHLFVISGFLVTRSALERWGSLDAVPWRAFLLRRAARIYPCLLLLLIVLAALRAGRARIRHRDHQPARARWRVGHAPELAGARTGYLPAAWNVLWSLSVEEAFYLAFPLLCMLALATENGC